MTAVNYISSKGPKAIADLPYSYLKNAHAKLLREEPNRADEIAAMGAELAKRDAEFAATGHAPTGHNAPPVETPVAPPTPEPMTFDMIAKRIDDLDTEARNWADGTPIANEAQADEVNALIAMIKRAITETEALQADEIKPLADAEKKIRERYYPLIGKTTKITGTAIRDLTALLAAKTKWGAVLRTQQDDEANRLRDEAAKLASQAREIIKEAADNIEAAESAEAIIKAAQTTLRAAKAAEKPVTGGFRDNWEIDGFDDTVGDGRVILMRHVFKTDPAALIEFCLEWSRSEMRRGVRTIPGLVINNNRKAF